MFSLYVTVCIPRIKTYQMLYHISFWFVCIYTCYCLYHRHCGPGGSNNEYPEGEDLRDVDEEVLSFTQTSRQLHQRLPRKTQTTAGDTFVCLIPVRVVSFITVLQFLWATSFCRLQILEVDFVGFFPDLVVSRGRLFLWTVSLWRCG